MKGIKDSKSTGRVGRWGVGAGLPPAMEPALLRTHKSTLPEGNRSPVRIGNSYGLDIEEILTLPLSRESENWRDPSPWFLCSPPRVEQDELTCRSCL